MENGEYVYINGGQIYNKISFLVAMIKVNLIMLVSLQKTL